MTPEECRRLALLWHKVEKLIFSPPNVEEQRNWCTCFLRSLADYWGEEHGYTGAAFPGGEFQIPIPGISASYDLGQWNGNPPRTAMRLKYEDVPFASLDTDQAFPDRLSLFEPPAGSILAEYPNTTTRAADLRADVVCVLNAYVMHPCAHLHAMEDIFRTLWDSPSPSTMESLHAMRLGTGLTNPFACLFQFRLQFALGESLPETEALKEAERDRVADLICTTVLADNPVQHIKPGKLFGLK